MQRVPANHRALRRSIPGLGVRDPSPVDLPPLNSVPVVGPLLGSPSTSPNTQPAPTPATGSGGGGGNGGNGNGGNGNGGNGNGGNGNGGNGNGGNGNGGNGNGGNGNGGNGNGGSGSNSSNGGGGGGSTPTPTATSGGGTGVSQISIAPSQISPTSAPANNSGSSGASSTSSGGGTVSSGLGGSGDFLGVGVAPTGSSTAASAALGASIAGVQATGYLSASQHSLGSGSKPINTASPSPIIATSAAVLSGGAIAGIIIVCLIFLLALILLVVRRHSIARRMEIRGKWWFGWHASGGKGFFVDNGSPNSILGSGEETPASRLSSRSSFATNFDQGLMVHGGSPQRFSLGVVPDFPPLVEVRERNAVSISTGGETTRTESINNMLSSGSEPGAQYLTVSGSKILEPSTPMSVRPFSPSESFAFPKPPPQPSSAVDSFFLPGTQDTGSFRSSATLVHLSPPPRALVTDLPPTSVSTPSLHVQTSTSNAILSPPISTANPPVDPFADPEFADVEVIRRPFTPSLADELAVYPGDRVRLLRIFDDGWAFIEKLTDTEGERHERGLIPVDCLRESNQALPTFLAQRGLQPVS